MFFVALGVTDSAVNELMVLFFIPCLLGHPHPPKRLASEIADVPPPGVAGSSSLLLLFYFTTSFIVWLPFSVLTVA